MYLAHAAALRSSSLARQVGASILSQDGDVLCIGTNEVPKYGGGAYWEKDVADGVEAPDEDDGRDHKKGRDSNDEMQRKLMAEVLQELDPNWPNLSESAREARLDQACQALKASGARIMNLTEFGRAVHAEMSALMSASRTGTPVRSCSLFTTTFPCHGCTKHIHGCTKHIIDSGLARVVYIEPYPKSLASYFHSDAISIEDSEETNAAKRRVKFEPFVGISPRRYTDLFSMRTKEGRETRRKNKIGMVETTPIGLRLSKQPHTYIDKEELAAAKLLEEGAQPSL